MLICYVRYRITLKLLLHFNSDVNLSRSVLNYAAHQNLRTLTIVFKKDEKIMPKNYCTEIQEKGYVKIPQLVDKATLTTLKNSVDHRWQILQKNPLKAEDAPYLNQGHLIIYNLQNKDIFCFQIFLKNPVLRAILIDCLNDQWYKQIPQSQPNFILRSLSARSSGNTGMPLHIDSFIPNPGSHMWVLQVAIVLEEQNRENGCTLVLPGSHRLGTYASQDWLQYATPIESNPGDVVIWDSRLWHGAMPNTTTKTRWSIIATFSRWWIKQNYNITGNLPKHILQNLSDEEMSVLGFCSIPPQDEHERQDIKTGYEVLKEFKQTIKDLI